MQNFSGRPHSVSRVGGRENEHSLLILARTIPQVKRDLTAWSRVSQLQKLEGSLNFDERRSLAYPKFLEKRSFKR